MVLLFQWNYSQITTISVLRSDSCYAQLNIDLLEADILCGLSCCYNVFSSVRPFIFVTPLKIGWLIDWVEENGTLFNLFPFVCAHKSWHVIDFLVSVSQSRPLAPLWTSQFNKKKPSLESAMFGLPFKVPTQLERLSATTWKSCTHANTPPDTARLRSPCAAIESETGVKFVQTSLAVAMATAGLFNRSQPKGTTCRRAICKSRVWQICSLVAIGQTSETCCVPYATFSDSNVVSNSGLELKSSSQRMNVHPKRKVDFFFLLPAGIRI